jgi:hypothetical protein
VAGAEGRSHVLVVSHHGSSMGSGGVWGSATAHAEQSRGGWSRAAGVASRRGEGKREIGSVLTTRVLWPVAAWTSITTRANAVPVEIRSITHQFIHQIGLVESMCSKQLLGSTASELRCRGDHIHTIYKGNASV